MNSPDLRRPKSKPLMLGLFFACCSLVVSGEDILIEWSPLNKKFGQLLGNHMTVYENDVLRFRCDPNTPSIIYRVNDRTAYDNCELNANSEKVFICEKGRNATSRIKIRKIQPHPSLLNFTVYREYYFLTTSTGEATGMNNNQSGLCGKFDMRLGMIVFPKIAKNVSNNGYGHTLYGASKLISNKARHEESAYYPPSVIIEDDRVRAPQKFVKREFEKATVKFVSLANEPTLPTIPASKSNEMDDSDYDLISHQIASAPYSDEEKQIIHRYRIMNKQTPGFTEDMRMMAIMGNAGSASIPGCVIFSIMFCIVLLPRD